MKRKWGWKPDELDFRDFPFKRVTRVKVPDKVDLRPGCSHIEDQQSLGSCTANAGAGLYEFLEKKQGMAQADASRLFLYYNTRILEGTVREDSGASIRNTIKAMAKWGMCAEKRWPYDIKRFTVKPSSDCYKEGVKHVAIVYQRLQTLDDMLKCLADGFPFEFGFAVYESFESDQVTKTGIVSMPKKTEEFLGGHAVIAVGYDQAKKRFIVRNSWGGDWGVNGYCFMPFAYLTDRNLSDDLWVVRKQS